MKTDAELTLACAEAVGWGHLRQFTNRITDPNGNAVFFNPDKETKISQLPPFPTSADAAMQLVEFLKRNGWWCELRYNPKERSCIFWKPGNGFSHEKVSDTLPRAICLAFLKAVEAMK